MCACEETEKTVIIVLFFKFQYREKISVTYWRMILRTSFERPFLSFFFSVVFEETLKKLENSTKLSKL